MRCVAFVQVIKQYHEIEKGLGKVIVKLANKLAGNRVFCKFSKDIVLYYVYGKTVHLNNVQF